MEVTHQNIEKNTYKGKVRDMANMCLILLILQNKEIKREKIIENSLKLMKEQLCCEGNLEGKFFQLLENTYQEVK